MCFLLGEAAPDVTAPELLKDDGKQVNNLEELQKVYTDQKISLFTFLSLSLDSCVQFRCCTAISNRQ